MKDSEQFAAARSLFASFVAVMLIITAVAKLISCITHPGLGQEKDFVFHFLSVRQVLAITALLELVVAGVLLVPERPGFAAWLSLFWLSGCFLMYRLGPLLVMGHTQAPCRCLGELSSAASRPITDTALKALLGLMLFGSLWFAVREARHAASRYVSCPVES